MPVRQGGCGESVHAENDAPGYRSQNVCRSVSPMPRSSSGRWSRCRPSPWRCPRCRSWYRLGPIGRWLAVALGRVSWRNGLALVAASSASRTRTAKRGRPSARGLGSSIGFSDRPQQVDLPRTGARDDLRGGRDVWRERRQNAFIRTQLARGRWPTTPCHGAPGPGGCDGAGVGEGGGSPRHDEGDEGKGPPPSAPDPGPGAGVGSSTRGAAAGRSLACLRPHRPGRPLPLRRRARSAGDGQDACSSAAAGADDRRCAESAVVHDFREGRAVVLLRLLTSCEYLFRRCVRCLPPVSF